MIETDQEHEGSLKHDQATKRLASAIQELPSARDSEHIQNITQRAQRAIAEANNAYRDLEDRMQQRTQEMEQLIKELNAFSYSVSHDLRGPLRAIHGFAKSVIDEGNLDERSATDLQRIRAAAVRMEQLIDDLLKLSRAARQTLDRRDVDLTECAIALSDDLRREHAHAVELTIAPDMNVFADSGLLIIALQNLLSNAWKFTAKTPQARVEVGVKDENGERAYFVRDNGDGFDMAYADQLFTAFQRLHHTADFPGTGIGLAIAHRIIARHGGRIWAEAAPQRGATFYFTLPNG